jgi:hypothetical protein
MKNIIIGQVCVIYDDKTRQYIAPAAKHLPVYSDDKQRDPNWQNRAANVMAEEARRTYSRCKAEQWAADLARMVDQ